MINLNKRFRKYLSFTDYQLFRALQVRTCVAKMRVIHVESDGHYMIGSYKPIFGDEQLFVCHVSNSWEMNNVKIGQKIKLISSFAEINRSSSRTYISMINCRVA